MEYDPVAIVTARMQICHAPKVRGGDLHDHAGQIANGTSVCAGCACQAIDAGVEIAIRDLRGAFQAEISGTPCGEDCAGGGYHKCIGCEQRARRVLSNLPGKR